MGPHGRPLGQGRQGLLSRRLAVHARPMHVMATAALGTEELVERECRALDLDVLGRDRAGVHLDLGPRGIARALVHLRVATRLLLRLGEFPASTGEALYAGAKELPWTEWMDPQATFAVFASGDLVPDQNDRRGLNHHVFVAQKVKDALCDRLRARYGRRPNVDVQDPDIRIAVRGHRARWTVWLDLSGPPLHERGVRTRQLTAPLKETLAAAVAMLTEWNPANPLRDPFCGAGTLVVESLNLALGLAPGCTRWFGVERWPFHGPELQKELDIVRAEAVEKARIVLGNQRQLDTSKLDIEASDIDPRAVDVTRENLRNAGLDRVVRVVQRDARKLSPQPAGTQIVTNPPYGERLGDEHILKLYADMGQDWRQIPDLKAAILMGNTEFVPTFGWPVLSAHELRNGPLEVGLFQFHNPAA